MSRRCGWCRGEFRDDQAREVYTPTAISGFERPVYACDGCIRVRGLLPRAEPAVPVGAATFIGRPDYAPSLAAEEQPPKVCGRCGRVVTAYTVRTGEEDHGPLETVWCQDAEACSVARATARSRRTRLGMMLPRHPG